MVERAWLAKKYAKALMRHYRWYELERDMIYRIAAVADFLHQYRRLFFYEPSSLYASVFEGFGSASAHTHEMVQLLEQQQRLFLLPDILHAVVALYQQYWGVEICLVKSAQSLTEAQKNDVRALLSARVDKKLYCVYEVDPTLIAGIKVRGQTFIWEDSIAQRLSAIERGSRVG